MTDDMIRELEDIRAEHPRLMKAFETGEFPLPKEELKRLTVELSDVALSYTLMYIKKKSKNKIWTIQDQILHTHSELSEVYEEIRKGKDLDHLIHEIIDVVFSSLTLLNIAGLKYFPEDFNKYKERIISEVVDKITNRLE